MDHLLQICSSKTVNQASAFTSWKVYCSAFVEKGQIFDKALITNQLLAKISF